MITLLLAIAALPHWCGGFPIALKTDPAMPPEISARLLEDAMLWNTIGFGKLLKVATPEDKDPVTLIWSDKKDNQLCGSAPDTIERPEIECITGRKIFIFTLCNGLYHTASHEIGHLLGLEHSTDVRDLMFPTLGPDQKFTAYERNGLRRLYRAAR